jgi:glycosyltransferase involved in cell wall biosynthesis/GT2 family glycosyltransferase
MSGLAIGVQVHAVPERLSATLASLRAHAPSGASVLLFPDGPDAATRAALAAPPFAGLPQIATDEPRGVAACWNRLVAATDADVLMLLESGAVVAPGALDLLLAALTSNPAHGLAGPSTNLCWNEQGAFPGAPGHPEGIAATAIQARRRYGGAVRVLAPLHSLAEFCFAARRDVVAAIDAADEDYGLGPCWEMDYNARAARAGFLGVWVGAAYVHRAPPTARRHIEEARRFEASRRRYQDKLCGRRLRGERFPYESHCRGDGCPDFAPAALIRIREPRGTDTQAQTAAVEAAPVARSPPPVADAAATITSGDRPFVSCIMPTRDRRAWVPHAIRCFSRQDFVDAELVILDDGDEPAADLVPAHPRIRYHRASGRQTVGAKRNEACRLARGELIAHWDDDDWYAPTRLRRQVEGLHAAGAGIDVCGTSTLYFYEPFGDRAWRYTYGGGSTPMLVGTSLLYRRRAWERAPFADIQVGEDVRFVRAAGRSLVDLRDPALVVATVHDGNTSRRTPGALFWAPYPPREIHRLLGDELPFFTSQRRAGEPLISCIMPTADRRRFLPLSLSCFLEQDWPNRELIVVDDGADDVGDLVSAVPGARHIRVPKRTSIGEKRNLACREARGEIIAHWDDDDWYGPGRLRWQVEPILSGRADLTGLENRFVLRLPAGEFWTIVPELHRRMFVGDVHGGTIVFRRSLFTEGVRYPAASLAEDAALIREAVRRGRRLLRLENPELFVYVRHGANAWQFDVGRFIDPRGWRPVAPPASLPRATLDGFRAAALAGGR